MPAIDARAKRLPLEVSLDVDPALAHRRFERRIEGAAYFLASEALANIVKHAEATEVTITLALQSDCLVLTISDNGRGSDAGRRDGAQGSPTWPTGRRRWAAVSPCGPTVSSARP